MGKKNGSQWTEETFRLNGADLVVLKTGRGKPALVLHEEHGHPGALAWHDEIGATHTLLTPLHPGFGRTPRTEWIGNVRDLACFYAAFLRTQKLAPIDVIGFSFGGWIAAEMMANDPTLLRRAVLVAPPGVRPTRGEMFDLFTVTPKKYLNASVLDASNNPEFAKLFGGEPTPEQFEAWEDARAQMARFAWVPYLFNASLPHLLELVTPPPTLIIWGREDAIVPIGASDVYAKCIAGSKRIVFQRCGHRPEIERREEFVKEVITFLG